MAAQQHKLKKRLRELKRLRTAVITGDEKKYTLDQVNDAIENVRVELGTAEDRAVVVKYDLFDWQYLDGLDYTLEQYTKLLNKGVKPRQIAREWGLSLRVLKKYMENEGEKKMAKLTVEQYKEYVGKGMTTKEIASYAGISEASVYQYKAKFKKAGLLDDTKEVVQVVHNDELERMTKMYHAAQKKNEELSEQMDELETQYNSLNKEYKESDDIANIMITKYIEQSRRYKDLQAIASGYEHHESELQDKIVCLKEQLTAERDKHKNDVAYDDLKAQYNDLQQRYDLLAKVTTPLVTEFVKII